MSSIFTFAGRLHPVIVHLPIGILLLALLLELLANRPSRVAWKGAADLTLGIGVLSAALSCCTGYLLSLGGDYDHALVTTHQWLAIFLTVLSGLLYALIKDRPMDRVSGALAVSVLVMIFLTGHWGGSLTRGPGYLTEGLGEDTEQPVLRPVADVQAAVAYTSMVQPVLQDNCYRCHSAVKTKGGLRLDGPAYIGKGGKDGPVIVAGQATSSLLIKRILLPLADEHHMAPKERPQLTKAEVELLKWWINTGASFDKTVGSLAQDSVIGPVLIAFHNGTAGRIASTAVTQPNIADSDMPSTPVVPAQAGVLAQLRSAGALVLPIATGSNWLAVSFPNDTAGKDIWRLLPSVKDQLVSLKCSFMPVGDVALPYMAQCTHLVRLWLDHTAITGKGLSDLANLSRLRYLNLTGTSVTAQDLLGLRSLSGIHAIYLYQTKVDKREWEALQSAFPRTRLDSGGYEMPFDPKDTAIVRPTPRKP